MPRARRALAALLAASTLAFVAACNGSPRTAASVRSSASPAASASASPTPKAPPVDPASVHADELGMVPVLMYHQFLAHPQSVYDQTLASFRAELGRLYREHYVPVLASDFVAGHIDVPAGTHPVVLTFDDATGSQLRLGADGEPTSACAVGVLEAFSKTHPGFPAVGTFYVNQAPFSSDKRALPWLVAHGFEIGEHTLTHADLATLSPAAVQEEMVKDLAVIHGELPGYDVKTMALPFGIFPKKHALASRGAWHGTSYSFSAVFLVGYLPSHSPYAKTFDPLNLPRVRSGTALDHQPMFTSPWWLDYLAKHPKERFTSDGDPATISFPKSEAGRLAPKWAGQARPY